MICHACPKILRAESAEYLEREPVVDYPTFLWSDYPTDYPISNTRPPVVLSVG